MTAENFIDRALSCLLACGDGVTCHGVALVAMLE